MVYVPSFISGVTDQSYVFANSWDGETGYVPNSFRNTMAIGTAWVSNTQALWNNTISESDNNNTAYSGLPCAIFSQTQFWQYTQQNYRWADNSLNASDVLLCHGWYSQAEGKIRGQFYDMVYIGEAFALDTTDTFMGHTWVNMTNNQTGIPRGGVWIATS
jgi:hypothetical protein